MSRLDQLREIAKARKSRVQAHVAERDGGRLDVALTVDGIEIGWLNLLADEPAGIFTNADDAPCGCNADGEMVPLPAEDAA